MSLGLPLVPVLNGGLVCDALLARAAEKGAAERILTFNQDHLRRVWPRGAPLLTVP